MLPDRLLAVHSSLLIRHHNIVNSADSSLSHTYVVYLLTCLLSVLPAGSPCRENTGPVCSPFQTYFLEYRLAHKGVLNVQGGERVGL